MKDSDKQFICPLVWYQVSCNPDGILRLCCHGQKDNILDKKSTIFDDNKDILNHPFYKKTRVQMMSGEIPPGCLSCKKIEQLGGMSPRVKYLKSITPEVEKAISGTDENGEIQGQVTYIDLTLGNKCNFECRMCSPVFSDKLRSTFDSIGIHYNENLVDHIEKIWDKKTVDIPLIFEETIKLVYFQGGEPLLSHHHLAILEKLINTGRSEEISLSYNTNLSVLPLKVTEKWKHFKSIDLDVSLDGTGKVFEYIRHGSRWEIVDKNIKKICGGLVGNNIQLRFSTLLQAYLVPGIVDLLGYVLKLRNCTDMSPMFKLIHFPAFLSINSLRPSVFHKFNNQITDFIKKNELKNCPNIKELITLLESYEYSPELEFDFILYTKRLDSHFKKNRQFIEFIK